MSITLTCADVREWAETTPPRGAHALVCDPPYELNFMESKWDRSGVAFDPATWAALARHLLPGAWGMCFASSRGWHRLACAIEDAGMLLHPSIFCLGWMRAGGMPKATKIDTQVDAAAGAEREVVGPGPFARKKPYPYGNNGGTFSDDAYIRPAGDIQTAPATPLARTWAGHRYGGQVLRPSLEPIIVWQKPYGRQRPVDSMTQTGAGGLWIEGSRVEGKRWPPNACLVHHPACQEAGTQRIRHPSGPASGPTLGRKAIETGIYGRYSGQVASVPYYGDASGHETVTRWQCHEDCPVLAFERQAGESKAGGPKDCRGQPHGYMNARHSTRNQVYASYGDAGSASRFFPQFGWSDEIGERIALADPTFYCGKASPAERAAGGDESTLHPCVKPLQLCTWLSALLAPPAAYAPRRLLIPFAGSGSECIAAVLQGSWEEVLAIEQEPAYIALAERRLAYWTGQRSTVEPQGEPAPAPTQTGEGQLSLW